MTERTAPIQCDVVDDSDPIAVVLLPQPDGTYKVALEITSPTGEQWTVQGITTYPNVVVASSHAAELRATMNHVMSCCDCERPVSAVAMA